MNFRNPKKDYNSEISIDLWVKDLIPDGTIELVNIFSLVQLKYTRCHYSK